MRTKWEAERKDNDICPELPIHISNASNLSLSSNLSPPQAQNDDQENKNQSNQQN